MGINLNKTDGGVKVSLTKGASKAEIDNLYAQTLAAKVAAETAETNAETAETGAAGSATAAAGSATNASTSATAASASETAAANSATAAAASETAAASSETDSATSATASANSATASAGSATASANSATASAGSATTAASEATDSANSATASAASATASASSATDSATSATASAGSATASAASATAAAASETTVLASETNIEALFDAFDDRFLGTKTADPTLDNDGNALLEGAVYYNSVADDVRFYNGTSWDAPASDAYASEVAAATSATNAATSATNAATSATNAATSETNASASETLAATYAANAASSYDQFDDRYLGSKTADPALDNDGNALIVGALYFNTTDGVMKVYTASGWVNASSSLVATLSKFFFTATASQTVFSGTDDEGETFTCAPEFTLVTLNGVVLEDGSDYTATASAITLTAGANAGDELNIIAFANFESANFYTKTAGDARYLLDSEVTNLAQVKAFDSADYATAAHNHTGVYQPLDTVLTNTTASYTTAEETKLAGIETGATADQTKADIDALGIDADTLDGLQLDSSSNTGARANVIPYIKSDSVLEVGKYIDFHDLGSTADYDIRMSASPGSVTFTGNIELSGTVDGRDVSTDGTKLDGIEAGATADQTASEILTAIKTVDGSGSGLDADLLDGVSANGIKGSIYATTLSSANDLNSLSDGWYRWTNSVPVNGPFSYAIMLQATDGSQKVQFAFGNSNPGGMATRRADSGTFYTWNKMWGDQNDGAGSGLDADKVDGLQASSFLRSDASDVCVSGATIRDNTGNYGSFEIDGGSTGGYEGYSIGGRAVFMHNNSTKTGLYNDVENQWLVECFHAGNVNLHYAGASKLSTAASGVTIHGDADINGNADVSGTLNIGSGVKLSESTDRADLLQIESTTTTWGGLQITNNAGETLTSFMGEGTSFGIYDDQNGWWAAKWDEAGTAEFGAKGNIYNTINGASKSLLTSAGDFHADGDVIAYSTTISDERLKDNIQPIENALDKVSQLNGCTFTYTADGKESAGLIAQDVEKVLPSAVSEKELPLKTDDGETYKVLQYDQTIGLLVEAVKELTEQNKALTARVEELEAK